MDMELGWETLLLEYWAEQAQKSASFGSCKLQLKQTKITLGIRRLHHHACVLETCSVSGTLKISWLQSVMCKKPGLHRGSSTGKKVPCNDNQMSMNEWLGEPGRPEATPGNWTPSPARPQPGLLRSTRTVGFAGQEVFWFPWVNHVL